MTNQTKHRQTHGRKKLVVTGRIARFGKTPVREYVFSHPATRVKEKDIERRRKILKDLLENNGPVPSCENPAFFIHILDGRNLTSAYLLEGISLHRRAVKLENGQWKEGNAGEPIPQEGEVISHETAYMREYLQDRKWTFATPNEAYDRLVNAPFYQAEEHGEAD